MVNKAGSKNPSLLFGRVAPYSPIIQADQLQFARKAVAEAGNTIPLPLANRNASQTPANQARIQAEYTQYPFLGTLGPSPVLLIPRNTNRSNFYVINLTGGTPIFMSFGVTGNPGLMGFPIAGNEWFSETNGVISINDIYISCGSSTTVSVLGYEGIPSIGTGP